MGVWAEKIETVTWNIAGLSSNEYSKSVSVAYDAEMNGTTAGSKAASMKTIDAQVGLMYVSDYGYATSQENWQVGLTSSSETKRSTNWLYNAVFEWTISRGSDDVRSNINIRSSGDLGVNYGSNNSSGIRPCFYLKQDVKYVSGEGSYDKPIFLS